MTSFDLIGFLGIAISLVSYFLLQHGSLSACDGRYAAMQIAACILLITSLMHDFNLPAFLLNVTVIVVTLYGFIRFRLKGSHPRVR